MWRLKAFFQGLTWQFIVSYLIVTLAVTLTLQALVALGPLFQEAKGESVTPAQILEKQAGALVAPFLGQPNPDREALQYLAAMPLFSALKQADTRLTLVMILDRNGQSLASGACTQPQLLASGSQVCFTTASQLTSGLQAHPAVQDAIRGVLNGTHEVAGVSSVVVDGHTILTVPVIGSQKQLAGAVSAVFSGSLNPSSSPALGVWGLTTALAAAYWDRWQFTWLYFLLLATLIGAFTGFLASRRLTFRLQRLMLAAKAWSQGEFQIEIQDRAPDEVGQLARDLNRMAGEVQSLLASRQLLAVLDERNRLARDLHDTVKQQVFSSALLVHAARKSFDNDPVVARRHLEESEALHEKIQAALVEALQALKPAAVMDKGLPDILREFVDAWRRRNNIAVDLSVKLAPSLPAEIEETLYRVAQEALANIARHSGAQRVEIRIEQEDREVKMTIRDDGHGFDPVASMGKGSGLANMRERVELVQGKLELSSSPKGSLLVARISGIEPQFSA